MTITTAKENITAARDALQKAYGATRPNSAALYERALAVLPGGNSRTQLYFPPFPFYVSSAVGCRITDVDGHTYLDLVSNYTSLVHGHPTPDLLATISAQAAAGTAYGAPAPVEVELAEELSRRMPSLERVRFANSGTEAVIYACRAARLFTGRTDLIRAEGGYDGGHDGMQVGLKTFSDDVASLPEAGVPDWVAEHTHLMPFNDIEASVAVIERVGPRSAAVVIEPVQGYAGHLPAAPGYLDAVREAATGAGCLLIFDEVLTFRLHVGGAQAIYGVTPDLTALGKLIGGGFPVGAFGGRADVMAAFDPRHPAVPFHGGTFNANPMSLAAGLEYMRQLTPEAVTRINAFGDELRDHINAQAVQLGVAVVASGIGSLLRLHGGSTVPDSARDALTRDQSLPELLYYLLLEEGVFMGTKRGVMCMSTAMGEADVAEIRSAFTKSLTRLATVLEGDS
ncbi:MAG: aspartate aminotransferase family protein [Acidimicrobiia bacterium]|nr:aspartate aminotransferase family protein [Acidimicrobiia bacterium]